MHCVRINYMLKAMGVTGPKQQAPELTLRRVLMIHTRVPCAMRANACGNILTASFFFISTRPSVDRLIYSDDACVREQSIQGARLGDGASEAA